MNTEMNILERIAQLRTEVAALNARLAYQLSHQGQ